jgi:glutamate 5-kinase
MRDFSSIGRVVVKIGTNVLSNDSEIDVSYVHDMAQQITHLIRRGLQVLVVTSGAIGFGARELGLSGRIQSVPLRQSCAAIGQPILMNTYKAAFAAHSLKVAQVLLTREVLNNRTSYLNLRNAVESLLELAVIPVFNENDSVSTFEIGTTFGDNDQLSALIASKVDADLLIMLTDIDGLYSDDPRRNPDAVLMSSVDSITDDLLKRCGKPGSGVGTGGMSTKVKAAAIAGRAGCRTVLAHGRSPDILRRILSGEEVGTVFPALDRIKNRLRWIMNSEPAGYIMVDQGAIDAMRRKNSLLPTGVRKVDGVFPAGSVVMVNHVAKIVTNMNSTELGAVIGLHSSEVAKRLGSGKKDVIARPEDTVFLDHKAQAAEFGGGSKGIHTGMATNDDGMS